MPDGALMATFMIVFRETLEAGLVVGIILAMLSRLSAMRYAPLVWGSVASAVLASAAIGGLLSLATGLAQGFWAECLEGLISFLACGVLTYMVWWMDRQARRIRPEVEERVEVAVSRQELWAIGALPFLAVLREGAETALFLQAVALQSGRAVSLLGGLLGACAALAVTLGVFLGGRRVPLRLLFRSTGVLLLLMAAGLLAHGIHAFQELGWVPLLIYPVWDMNGILNETRGLGAILKALFGYNGNPSLTELVGYVAYLAGVGVWLARWRKPARPPVLPPSPPRPTCQEAPEAPQVATAARYQCRSNYYGLTLQYRVPHLLRRTDISSPFG